MRGVSASVWTVLAEVRAARRKPATMNTAPRMAHAMAKNLAAGPSDTLRLKAARIVAAADAVG